MNEMKLKEWILDRLENKTVKGLTPLGDNYQAEWKENPDNLIQGPKRTHDGRVAYKNKDYEAVIYVDIEPLQDSVNFTNAEKPFDCKQEKLDKLVDLFKTTLAKKGNYELRVINNNYVRMKRIV